MTLALAYYNDNEKYCVAWLTNLINAGHLPAGCVDGRNIEEITADDLEGYEQVHLFAGVGGWPRALELAGWTGPVWTASCPCQPFSTAGQQKGFDDKRHLWPYVRDLVAECRPPVIFGEQVASPLGREWVGGVRADLEELGYEVGAADLCAASAGAPHIRQRLFWVAHANMPSSRTRRPSGGQQQIHHKDGGTGGLAQPPEFDGRAGARRQDGAQADNGSGLGDTKRRRPQSGSERSSRTITEISSSRCSEGFWSDFDLIPCADGKARRVGPGTFPLAHGVPNRVGRLRAYGNAIIPQIAAEFVQAVREARHAQTNR